MMHKLFPIPLLCPRTINIESLTSYIYRISYAHELYVGELLRYVQKHTKEIIQSNEPDLPKYFDPSILIRPNKTTEVAVKILEKMTLQTLSSSTLLFLKDCLSRPSNEFTKKLRWCPECFNENQQSEVESYFKLIWHIKSVNACHIHHTPFLSECEYCGCDQTGYRRNTTIEYCQKCGKPLFIRKTPLTLHEYIPSWEHTGIDLLKMLDSVLKEPKFNFSNQKVINSLQYLLDYYWERENEEYLYTIIPRDELLSLIYKQKPLTLLKLRRIAFKLDIPLLFLFNGSLSNTTELISADWSKNLPEDITVHHKSPPRDHEIIFRKINKIIKNSDKPPSLNSVVEQANISKGYLDYRFPSLSHDIVKKHKQYTKEQQDKKKKQALANATEYFFGIKYFDHPKSRKQCYKYLREKTGLPKFILKGAINDAYNNYCSEMNAH